MVINGDGKFQRWLASGLIYTIGWGVLLVVYSTFQVLKIEAPALDQAFLLLTGGWVGMLTLAQSRKNQKVEEDVSKLKKVAVEEHPEKAGELE